MRTSNRMAASLAPALMLLAANLLVIQPAVAQLPVTIFTNNFNSWSGTAPGYYYGDAANVSHTYVNGAGVGGSVGARITSDFKPPGSGYGRAAFQYQNGGVAGNTKTDLTNYMLYFDANPSRAGGGLQIVLQTWSGGGYSGTGPLTSSSLSDVILGDSNAFTTAR